MKTRTTEKYEQNMDEKEDYKNENMMYTEDSIVNKKQVSISIFRLILCMFCF